MKKINVYSSYDEFLTKRARELVKPFSDDQLAEVDISAHNQALETLSTEFSAHVLDSVDKENPFAQFIIERLEDIDWDILLWDEIIQAAEYEAASRGQNHDTSHGYVTKEDIEELLASMKR